jgi:hypothetical protein
MSDAILVDCSAVAVGRFNLYYNTTNIRLRSYRLTQKIGGIIYGTPLVYEKIRVHILHPHYS